MKRTIIIAPNYPLPENSGANMRTMNFVRYFQNYGEVDILCSKDNALPSDSNSPFKNKYFIDYTQVSTSKPCYFRRIIDKLIHMKTWATNQYTPENEQLIRQIVTDGNYDYIVCRYMAQAYPLLKLDSNIKDTIILDIDDIVTETIYDVDTAHLTGISKLNKNIDKFVLQRYYKRCMNLGSILFCSNDDKSKVSDCVTHLNCHVVPNVYSGMKLPDDYVCDGYNNINNILFVGSLKYEPNFRGITWFINNVLPPLVEQYQDIKLFVVGRTPPDELICLAKRYPNIELHADPPDIAPFYCKCGVVIVPLFAGGGTRIKILESGFVNRPVISTEIGAYGLGLTKGKEIMIFSGSDDFVENYKNLRENRILYSNMVQRFSASIINNYSFDNFSRSMDAVVNNPR